MKKLLIVTLLCMLLGGCGESPQVVIGVENTENVHNVMLGRSALLNIGDGLWYDSTTRIVYWWNGALTYGNQMSTSPSPYYAPNGLPYRYDPERNMLEEIE